MSTKNRIIIVQTAFLGDVILTLPLCSAIRTMRPDFEVVLVTTPAAAAFVQELGIVDQVVAFDKRGMHRSLVRQSSLARSLAGPGRTCVLVPHKSLRTALFVRSIGADTVVTYSDAMTRLFATDVVAYPHHQHDAQRHLSLLQPVLGLNAPLPDLEQLLPIALREAHTPVPFEPWGVHDDSPRIVLAPATVWPTKQWPLAQMQALARRLIQAGMRVAVIGDMSVRGCMEGVEGVCDLIGQTTLHQAATIIGSADCVVANDSAPVHLASLQGVGVVAIFGPTVPEFGFGPLGQRSRVVQRSDLTCRPCSAHGGAACPLGTHDCMNGIDVETVFRTIESILAHDVNRHAKSKEQTH